MTASMYLKILGEYSAREIIITISRIILNVWSTLRIHHPQDPNQIQDRPC